MILSNYLENSKSELPNEQSGNPEYRRCVRCIMDTSVSDIRFDDEGLCNYCSEFIRRSSNVIFEDKKSKVRRLENFVARVKKDGKNKKYDCIVGVSGGVDSSWALVQAIELGLRPLAVHMDNGWNSELAQNNIANLISSLNVDLYTHVIDWEEYRALMQAFFDADVIDIELLYDNAMAAVNYNKAAQYGIKYILSGSNLTTEGLQIPESWNWFKFDKKNIKSIVDEFSDTKINTFPSIGVIKYLYFEYIKRIKWISFLDYFNYNKFEALKDLETKYQYKRYPYKHYESIFTRFYQGYILPCKFDVDKRLVHLSSLIISGQISRDEALEGIQGIPYPSIHDQEKDIKYFLKKMKWSENDLELYLNRQAICHSEYSSEKPLFKFLIKLNNIIRRIKKY